MISMEKRTRDAQSEFATGQLVGNEFASVVQDIFFSWRGEVLWTTCKCKWNQPVTTGVISRSTMLIGFSFNYFRVVQTVLTL